MPEAARPALDLLAAQLRDIRTRIAEVTKRIEGSRAEDALARRLATIPCIGALTVSRAGGDDTRGRYLPFGPRDDAAWPGLTPKPHSTGGKERLEARNIDYVARLRANPALDRLAAPYMKRPRRAEGTPAA